MAKIKTKYDELCAQITEKVTKNGSSSHSKTDLVAMAQTMINTPEHEVDVYAKNSDGTATVAKTTPVARYRESLKPVLKTFGIDKDEMNRISEVSFTREHAEAIAELGVNLIKDYTSTGRKLVFPINAKDEAQMAISQTRVDEKKTEPRKIVKDEETGVYSSILTGKKVTTKEHDAIKATNKIPGWLRDVK